MSEYESEYESDYECNGWSKTRLMEEEKEKAYLEQIRKEEIENNHDDEDDTDEENDDGSISEFTKEELEEYDDEFLQDLLEYRNEQRLKGKIDLVVISREIKKDTTLSYNTKQMYIRHINKIFSETYEPNPLDMFQSSSKRAINLIDNIRDRNTKKFLTYPYKISYIKACLWVIHHFYDKFTDIKKRDDTIISMDKYIEKHECKTVKEKKAHELKQQHKQKQRNDKIKKIDEEKKIKNEQKKEMLCNMLNRHDYYKNIKTDEYDENSQMAALSWLIVNNVFITQKNLIDVMIYDDYTTESNNYINVNTNEYIHDNMIKPLPNEFNDMVRSGVGNNFITNKQNKRYATVEGMIKAINKNLKCSYNKLK